jgi:serine/threonine protein kinase
LEKVARTPVTFSKNLSDDLKDFIRKCLTIEEDRRISLTEMESHPFIKRTVNDGYMDEYQSAPPLLNKISSNTEKNTENKEPVEQTKQTKE